MLTPQLKRNIADGDIDEGTAGNKGNKMYGRYADLFESMDTAPEKGDN